MPDASGVLPVTLPSTDRLLKSLLGDILPEPIWHTLPARGRSDGVRWSHERWKPSVYPILDPLHGHRGAQQPDGSFAVTRPAFAERVKRYLQALGIVYAFSAWEDLLSIAVHRRQVSNLRDVPAIDHPFYLLVCAAGGFYHPTDIEHLAGRMPPDTSIQRMLLNLAAVRRT